jgi:predicted ester cyclase
VVDGESVLDIRTYRTVPGGREEFLRIMADDAVPMLRRYGVDVVAFGPAVQDDDHAILIRFFASLQERAQQLERFYSSEEWLTDHDPRVTPLIETYHTVVLPASPEVAAALSTLGRIEEGGAPDGPDPEANKHLVRALVDKVWNLEDPSFADEVFPPDWQTSPELPPGPEGVKRWAIEDHVTFPDVRYAIEDLLAEGDRVVVRWTASGTQKGQFGPIPPTGKSVTWTGIHVFRVRDGRFVDYRVEADSLGRLRQLGVELVPPSA